ncbi:Cytochrome c oxidase polypeptide 5, partial [Hortaea werneckii]
MKVDWTEMTMNEKKAAYWVAFGPHGPRALPPPGENWKVFRLTMYGVLASLAIFLATRSFARGPPRTMTKEYQEATNEYMKEHNIEPITGVSSEGYVGKGQVQTDRSSKDLPPLEE